MIKKALKRNRVNSGRAESVNNGMLTSDIRNPEIVQALGEDEYIKDPNVAMAEKKLVTIRPTPLAVLKIYNDDKRTVNAVIRALRSQLSNRAFHLAKVTEYGIKVPMQKPKHTIKVWEFSKGGMRDTIRSLQKSNLSTLNRMIDIGFKPATVTMVDKTAASK